MIRQKSNIFQIYTVATIKIRREVENMKATGITRSVDELGRVVIPKEIIRSRGIKRKDNIEIYIDEDDEDIIILRLCTFGCYVCNSDKDLRKIKGKHICAKCLQKALEDVG